MPPRQPWADSSAWSEFVFGRRFRSRNAATREECFGNATKFCRGTDCFGPATCRIRRGGSPCGDLSSHRPCWRFACRGARRATIRILKRRFWGSPLRKCRQIPGGRGRRLRRRPRLRRPIVRRRMPGLPRRRNRRLRSPWRRPDNRRQCPRAHPRKARPCRRRSSVLRRPCRRRTPSGSSPSRSNQGRKAAVLPLRSLPGNRRLPFPRLRQRRRRLPPLTPLRRRRLRLLLRFPRRQRLRLLQETGPFLRSRSGISPMPTRPRNW